MASSAHLAATDSKLEGAVLGKCCVMFGRSGLVDGVASYRVTSSDGELIRHYVTDLTAGRRYALNGANEPAATASAAGVIAFTATGTGTSQTVSVSPA